MKTDDVIMNKEKEEDRTDTMENETKNWLVINLKDPVTYQGETITVIDLTKITELTGTDLNTIYDLYYDLGGQRTVMQEITLLFAQIVASKVTGRPVEVLERLKARDSMNLKNRVYRFFFLEE